jgi:hypothetical protein
MRRKRLILSLVLLVLPSVAAAQVELGSVVYRQPGFERFEIPTRDTTPSIKRTEWKRGGVIGASILGGAALLMAIGYCGAEYRSCPRGIALGTAAGAATGFALGAFIGGLVPER